MPTGPGVGWLWRSRAHIAAADNGGSAFSGFQYPVKIIIGAGTSGNFVHNGVTGSLLYVAATKIRSDFGDVRFYCYDGETVCDYDIVSKTDGDNAIFIVELAYNAQGVASVLDVYYGNSAVSTTENQANTFVDVISGAVLSMPLNEGTGTTLNDYSGNSNNATFPGGANNPSWTTGKFGSALSFDGSNDYVDIPAHASLTSFDELTVEFWCKPTTASGAFRRVIDHGWNAVGSFMIRLSDDYKMFMLITDSVGAVSAFKAVVQNTTYHIIGTFKKNDKVHVYLDNVDGSVSGGTANETLTENVATRLGGSSNQFGGIIENLHIYNAVLTADERAALANNYGDGNIEAGKVLVRKWASSTNPAHSSWEPEAPHAFGGSEYYHYKKRKLQPQQEPIEPLNPFTVDWSMSAVESEATQNRIEAALQQSRKIGMLKTKQEEN